MKEPAQVIDEWMALYATVPQLIGEGEKTLGMIARELEMDISTAKKYIDEWLLEGRIQEVGMRRMRNCRAVMAYKFIK